MSTPPNVHEGLSIQFEHLQAWKTVLTPEAYAALSDKLHKENAALPPGATYNDVFRGAQLDGFVTGLAASLRNAELTTPPSTVSYCNNIERIKPFMAPGFNYVVDGPVDGSPQAGGDYAVVNDGREFHATGKWDDVVSALRHTIGDTPFHIDQTPFSTKVTTVSGKEILTITRK